METHAEAKPAVTALWLENRFGASSIGIDERTPRLSWTIMGAQPQLAYTIEATDARGRSQTYTENSDQSHFVAWPFAGLASRDRVEIRVRVVDAAGTKSAWSPVLAVELGLTERTDWAEPFISPSIAAPHGPLRPAYLLRNEVDLSAAGIDIVQLRRARVYSSAHGVYELELNGRRIADDLLAPGWTSYSHRLRYQTHDITGLLRAGSNVLGAWLGDGWYRGRIGFDGGRWDYYGADVSLLAQLEVTLADGSVRRIPLAGGWRASLSPITAVGLYEGESYDARALPAGWSSPGFTEDDAWFEPQPLALEQFPAAIEAPTGPPVRVTEVLAPVDVTRLESGRIRLDFGQNIAGKLRIRVRGERGDVVRLHHAEVIENGELGTRPLRTASSIDSYIVAGDGLEEWTPRFTLHGFRYAELEGWPTGADEVDVEALVVHSDMMRTGWFETSNPALNRLHENVVWSMRDNFVDLPTDCPQRDERMGWTGDIQTFAPTALFLFGAEGVLTGWLRDVAAEQAVLGHVPNFVPWVECGFPNFPTAAWGDAAVIVPWAIFQHDGDIRILADQYESMTAWVDLVDGLAGHMGLWNTGFQLGDWLDPTAPPESPADSRTDRYLVATAYHAHTARLVAEAARILGRPEDSARYATIAARAVAAFQEEFISPNGRLVSDTVTAIALALVFELFVTPEQAARAGARMTELVAQADFHISTGFVGTPIVCDALVRAGSIDAAYHLLLQDELPSWLYAVGMGATTIWERWDSMLPDGSINPGGMTSFNHYALGAVADFMHRVVAGLELPKAGGASVRIHPRPGGGLTHASARHLTPYGYLGSAWRRDGETFILDVEVPAGLRAIVTMPDAPDATNEVGAGRHRFTATYRAASDDPLKPASPHWGA